MDSTSLAAKPATTALHHQHADTLSTYMMQMSITSKGFADMAHATQNDASLPPQQLSLPRSESCCSAKSWGSTVSRQSYKSGLNHLADETTGVAVPRCVVRHDPARNDPVVTMHSISEPLDLGSAWGQYIDNAHHQ
eukprot:CAMPEP_0183307072 /NCGR_PEP_ID=MMETSP0160_2-20130417/16031_1 /TAXON_ID=2839 ORGANISM="Odontella Sinensis, Strain Grunow 1884" /NCGR_SAMPLE_ID=MMETSP0160_2 /ASSEMBLY_ACC=CAM_ASM_000250 /LENGTH=135 /DNA_ID=CAMNT_0025470585 /DNA_START=88 /DNA_END=495 /DNA_ORIENTATION=+